MEKIIENRIVTRFFSTDLKFFIFSVLDVEEVEKFKKTIGGIMWLLAALAFEL